MLLDLCDYHSSVLREFLGEFLGDIAGRNLAQDVGLSLFHHVPSVLKNASVQSHSSHWYGAGIGSVYPRYNLLSCIVGREQCGATTRDISTLMTESIISTSNAGKVRSWNTSSGFHHPQRCFRLQCVMDCHLVRSLLQTAHQDHSDNRCGSQI